ncbi:cytochrome P450 [Ophiobolus disseminans]|uniref:Cytochrome P450 n=1 Tax=Ophiobolus disseminans TaxID=1469910 RepID=A0A6A6ZDF2_9PLEO|nr:cytochrome P450 [Ophiobolus disseminans]
MDFRELVSKMLKLEILVLGLSLFLVYLVSTAIYNLYFHPLAKLPGPFWARVSTIPSWYHTKNQNRHLWLLKLQEHYGPEFRHRPDSACINTPSAYRHIYGPRGNVKKSDQYKVWPRTVDALNTWNTTSVEIHAHKRRVLNYAFSEAALRSAEPFIHKNVDRWIELLGQRKGQGQDWTESINMADQVTYLVFDILGDLCFGKCFDMKETGSNLTYVVEMMIGFLETMHVVGWAPWRDAWVYLKPRGLDQVLALTLPATVKSWDAFVASCQESRARTQYEIEGKLDAETRKDFFHWLWEAKDPESGRGYTLPELNAECELLTIAGSDTTATVLSALLFYLSRNHNVQDRLADEVLAKFSTYDEIKSGNKLQSCQYLTAFLHEGMRMAPPVGADPSREVLEGGMTINERYYPAGSLVSTAFWSMQYNNDYYPAPLRFRPERWIVGEEGSTEESVAVAESAFCTFSTGPRGCVGKNMAWLEMRIVIAKLIWEFEVKRDPNSNLGGGSSNGEWGRRHEDQYQTWDIFVSNRKGPLVHLKKRVHENS